MKIALYCPNKPLDHPHPSGDLMIARSLRDGLRFLGHDCREVVPFRARWFWTTFRGWQQAAGAWIHGLRAAQVRQPRIWLTYHTYYKSPDVLGPSISRMVGIPYVLFQPMYSTRRRKAPGTRFGFYLNRVALKAARHAFVNNLDDLEALRRVIPTERVSYLPPGIFPEEFTRSEEARAAIRAQYHIPRDSLVIMTAARFRADVKFLSLTYLLKSLALPGTKRPPFTLLVVGDGPMEEELRGMAQKLLPGQVLFTGGIRREEMFRYYSAADLFAFPGIGESLGMVYLEAQACELPVVALNTAGVSQVVCHNGTGLLVPDDGGNSLAEAVERLLLDPQLRRRMAKEGHRFVHEQRNLHRNYVILSQSLEDIAG